MRGATKLRIARATDRLDEAVRFYRDGVGLRELGSFRDHDGFDGVMLGDPGGPYHLELTRQHGHPAGRAPTKENLLVFYLPERGEWEAAVARMGALGYEAVSSQNPYWERKGCTFEDPDGIRIVFQHDAWNL